MPKWWLLILPICNRRRKKMNNQKISIDEKQVTKRTKREPDDNRTLPSCSEQSGLVDLQQQLGNRAVQRLLAQRSSDKPFDLDDETADRINQQRGGGQPIDSAVQQQAGEAMGHDFSGVRAHTSPEANDLNQQLGAKAFTTGQDIFFREGAYQPHSSSGQVLIAHELTHVVQQSSGAVGGGGGKMTVNAPGDAFEQEAEAVAKAVTNPGPAEVQRQAIPDEEEEEAVQMQPEEEEEAGSGALQMQELDEQEEEAALE
jgi:hypothetical protein